MKRLTLVLIVAALALPQAGQAGWIRTFGGSGTDDGRCVQVLDDGYIVTGTRTLSSGKSSLWLLKVDSLGNEVWSKTHRVNETSEAWGNYVRITSDGGYILTGVDWSGFSQIWLLKTDSTGDTIWTKNYGRSQGLCVQEIPGEGYILTGRKEWNNPRLFLLKTNLNGDSLWMKTYLLDGWSFSIGLFVQQTDDKGYIVAGLIGDTAEYEQRSAFWLLKTDSNGTIIWNYQQGGINWGDSDIGLCAYQDKSGGYIALANFGLLKFSQIGDTLWTHKYGNSRFTQEISKGGYTLTGNSTSSLVFDATANPGDFWLLNTDNQGDSLWERSYFDGLSYYMEETPDKGFIVTGVKYGGDLFLLKTDSLGLLGVVENPIVEIDNGWNVPHSIGSYVVLHYQGLPQGFRANVFDVTGRKVDQIRGDGNEGAMTWGINYPPGVYFIQAMDNQNKLKTAKVVLLR